MRRPPCWSITSTSVSAYFGATDRYLQATAGGPNRDVIAMAYEGLGAKLESALQRAIADRAPTTIVAAKMIRDGESVAVGICVRPTEIEGQELLLVSFVDEPKPKRLRRAGATKAASARTAALEQDLDATRKELGGAIRDLEIAHEDHQAINEEAMTVNEEYQSSNEELKNSKEELRSSNEELEISKQELQTLNEELTALNHQLQETLAQQRDTTNDLRNVMYSSDVATLFLDTALNIRLFTPATTSLFRLIASDIGRPFEDFTPHFVDQKILTDARDVLANLAPVGCEVRTESAVYVRRILPYRTVEGTVDGVVITFADISEMKAAEAEIVAARAQADSIISSIRQPLVVLDEALHVVAAGRSFYDAFNATAEDTLGARLWKNDDHQLDVPALHDFLRKTRSDAGAVDDTRSRSMCRRGAGAGCCWKPVISGPSPRSRGRSCCRSMTSRSASRPRPRSRPRRPTPNAPIWQNPSSSPQPATTCANPCRPSA